MTRRVLFMSLKFPPLADIGAKRALRFVRRLPALGWQPTVLTLGQCGSGQRDPSLEPLLPSDVPVHRDYAPAALFRVIEEVKHRWSREVGRAVGERRVATGALERMKRRAIYALEDLAEGLVPTDEWLPFLPAGVAAGLRLLRREPHQVIYACGDPNSVYLAAWWLGKRTGLPVVLDLRDPWALDPTVSALKRRPVRWLEERLEQRVLADAARVILNTEETQRLYRQRYPRLPAERLEVIHNAFDDELVEPARPEPPAVPTIMHFGHYHRRRRSAVFLEGLAEWRRRHRGLPVRFVNFGEFQPEDLRYAGELGLGDAVEVRAPVPYRSCLRELRAASVLLLEQRNESGVQIPAKLYDYLLARRPILSLSNNRELAGLLARARAGVNVDPESPMQVADALEGLLAVGAAEFEARVDESALLRYSAAWTTQRLADILDSTAAAAARGGTSSA